MVSKDKKIVWPLGEHICPDCRHKESLAEMRERAGVDLEKAKTRQEQRWDIQCGIPWGDKTFENFKKELQPKAYKALKEWSGKSLVLLSPDLYGVGKTHLVCALANELRYHKPAAEFKENTWEIRLHRCPVLFVSENKMLARIRATFNHKDDGEAEEDVYGELIKTPLLIIDDVGKVRPKDPAFLQNVYFRVVDDRYIAELPIIMTTNLSLPDLETHIGGASADRLREMAGRDGFIKLAGKSYRHKT